MTQEPLEPDAGDEDGPEVGLDDLDRKIIAARAAGLTLENTAEAAGCSKSTVLRRLRKPGVDRAVAEEREAQVAQVVDVLTKVLPAAVSRLARILSSSATSDHDAVAAARIVLAEGRAWRDHKWTEDRLAEAEALIRERGLGS
ncbi:Lrp/AsnC family transcriptional regulator [Nocardioides sp. KR10-350]|uniref:Lrp/AsnC family transcriptional regulator n=1 Tax=Nocardioides cheoyonin TaxID=3156615 RepID=UPI0032B5E390